MAKFFYGNNVAFNAADSATLKSLFNTMHPRYRPPNRERLEGELFDTVCSELEDEAKKATNGAFATLSLDGWSIVANDPIIASSIQVNDKVYIVDVIDTNDEQHTAENLARISH